MYPPGAPSRGRAPDGQGDRHDAADVEAATLVGGAVAARDRDGRGAFANGPTGERAGLLAPQPPITANTERPAVAMRERRATCMPVDTYRPCAAASVPGEKKIGGLRTPPKGSRRPAAGARQQGDSCQRLWVGGRPRLGMGRAW
jgi:hypothetical protein